MFNFDLLATIDNDSYMKLLKVVQFEWADNFNDYDGNGISNEITGVGGLDVNTDDGSCFRMGCIYDLFFNYDPLATTSDAIVMSLLHGCMSGNGLIIIMTMMEMEYLMI